MLKTVSSIVNAIGALNYKGTWNANTNTPALASGVGTKGDYYVVAVAGATSLDGISNWGVGDWVTFNGSAWQRVEGGADLNGVNLTVSGTTTLSNGTANGVPYLNASKVLTTGSLLVFDGTNLGLGNAPKAWAGAGASALQRGSTSLFEYGTHNSIVGSNYYFDGSANKYINDGKATYYQQYDGGHSWETAAPGSADGLASFSVIMAVTGAGNFTISGSTATKASGTTWANPSDIRLKNNVAPYTGGLGQLLQIQVKTWEYNGKGGTQIGAKGLGVIADEALLVIPDSVDTYSAKLGKDDKENTDIKRFDATEITWLLVNSVKELSAQLDAALARIAVLESK
jgi:hypothetical protein